MAWFDKGRERDEARQPFIEEGEAASIGSRDNYPQSTMLLQSAPQVKVCDWGRIDPRDDYPQRAMLLQSAPNICGL